MPIKPLDSDCAGKLRPLRLTLTAEEGKSLAAYLRRQVRAAHAEIQTTALIELSIALVGDERMSDLHQQFLNIAGPTDVLTFPLDHDQIGRPTAGEVVICIPEARRRSAAEGTELGREVLLYALHGLLHLSGFDDRTKPGFRAMHAKEDAILTHLGVGAVFTPGGDRPASKPPSRSRKAAPAGSQPLLGQSGPPPSDLPHAAATAVRRTTARQGAPGRTEPLLRGARQAKGRAARGAD